MKDELDLLGEAEFIFRGAKRGKKARKGKPSLMAHASGSSAGVLGRIRRTVAKHPQVMVKVSGSARGRAHLKEHLSYITRNGDLVGEREDGTQVIGRQAVVDMAAEWWGSIGAGRGKAIRDTINIVLSMPAGTDRVAVERAARAFAAGEFGGKHDYLLVHHADTDHPHAHLTVKALGYQGQRLDPRKGDLQAWREGFAGQMRAQGVEAEATPRRARGQVQKGVRQAIRHMDKRQASRVSRWKIEQAIKVVRSGDVATPEAEPWRAATQERLKKTKRAWATLARALDGQGDVDLATRVRLYAETFPTTATTQRDQLVSAVQAGIAKRDQEQVRGRGK